MPHVVRKLIPGFVLSWYHFGLAFLGALLYGFPARKLTVVGLTGTNGKSTTVDMISRILKEAGLKTASLSSIRFQIHEREWRNRLKMTMPGRFGIQKFLRDAVTAGCTHAVVEVTSEGILQHRHRFLNFHTAVFTNLSPEHIERHGSFEKYREAKGKLFQSTKEVHIVNSDDSNAEYFLQFPAQKKYTYSMHAPKSSMLRSTILFAENTQAHQRGVSFTVEGTMIRLWLLGEFNVYNALAAICVGLSHGTSLETCKKALEKIEGVPGRMEVVIREPFRVVVDYAFTPAALEKVYKTLKPTPSSDGVPRVHHGAKLICILGAAGGGRDKWKRPVLGKIAATYCDKVIITNEDPYDEDPANIIEEVSQGTDGKGQKIFDRRAAICKGLSFASPGDTVVITGKGCEDSIAVAGGKKIPWDDRQVVREEMDKISRQ